MNLEKMTNEFKNSQFNKKHRSKENHYYIESDLEYAILKAYSDMAPRTLKKAKKGDKTAFICQNGKKEVLATLSDKIKGYIECTPVDFDKWHEGVCNDFCESFYEKALGKKYERIHFGKAQKIVNMTFKYLYCFDDDNKEVFNNCHMPIDKYILDWFVDKVCPEYKDYRSAWSNLDYGSDDQFGTYKWMQFQIKEYLKKTNKYPKEPLLAEFNIWQEYKEKSKK